MRKQPRAGAELLASRSGGSTSAFGQISAFGKTRRRGATRRQPHPLRIAGCRFASWRMRLAWAAPASGFRVFGRRRSRAAFLRFFAPGFRAAASPAAGRFCEIPDKRGIAARRQLGAKSRNPGIPTNLALSIASPCRIAGVVSPEVRPARQQDERTKGQQVAPRMPSASGAV